MNIEESIKRAHSQKLYCCSDEALVQKQLEKLDLLFEYNHLKPSMQEEKQALLKRMFAEFGEGSYIETPFYSNWGGMNVRFGKNVYANFNLTIIDDTYVNVGDYVMFGPNVVLATGSHPNAPELRKKAVQFNAPIIIKDNAWIGANTCIMPGVTIGENSIIGAGSVVTKDIPANVIAVGNPCRVLREINDYDREYYFKGLKIDID